MKKPKNKILSKFTSRPSYDLYVQLWYTLDTYLSRINEYIFLEYFKWNIPKISLIKKVNCNDMFILKNIYEYDYRVFKTLLFLYWDLECYLENTDNVKHTLKVELNEAGLFTIMYKNKAISNSEFWSKNSTKKPINLWTNLEIHGMFNEILKYEIYSKIHSLDTKLINNINLKNYKDLMIMYDGDIYTLRLIQSIDSNIDSSYYESYIDTWYKEWHSEINMDLITKYKSKLKDLGL